MRGEDRRIFRICEPIHGSQNAKLSDAVNMTTPEGVPVLDVLSGILEDGGMGSYQGIKHMLSGDPTKRAVVRQRKSRATVEKSEEDEELPLFAETYSW